MTYDKMVNVKVVNVLYSDAYEKKQHLRCPVSDVHDSRPSNFSLLLRCVLSEMGAGECPVRFCTILY